MDGLRQIFLGACFVFPFGFLPQESPGIQWMSLIEMMMEIQKKPFSMEMTKVKSELYNFFGVGGFDLTFSRIFGEIWLAS